MPLALLSTIHQCTFILKKDRVKKNVCFVIDVACWVMHILPHDALWYLCGQQDFESKLVLLRISLLPCPFKGKTPINIIK